MKNIIRGKIIIVILALIVLVEMGVLLGGNLNLKRQASPGRAASQVPETLAGPTLIAERNYWSERMDEVGGETAYREFKEQYADKNFGSQHLGAHIVGALLYKKAGIAGQTICDSTFSFGCYHSFFSQILADKGPSIIANLNQACLDKFGPLGTGCQHGIGHGVMEYFGPSRLLDALNACKPTTASSEISGCTSGVFMEYNVPIIITEEDATAVSRPVDPKKPYAPCPELPQNFQASCYYSIGQWWNQTDTYRYDWKTQGLLCKNIPNPSHMETCYLGIGNVAAPDNGFDPEKTIDSCKKMPDSKGIITCQAGASWSFAANPEYEPLAKKMCDKLSASDTKECLRLGNLLNPSNQ